jgi:hypothetical protein
LIILEKKDFARGIFREEPCNEEWDSIAAATGTSFSVLIFLPKTGQGLG